MKMPKYKIFRDETYVYYVEAESWQEAQDLADNSENDEGELLSTHHEVIALECEKKENDDE
jgi:predicted transcriptional regulator